MTMLKKILYPAAICVSAWHVSAAALENGPYVGAAISNSVVEENRSDGTTNFNVDSNAAGYKLFGGFSFNQNFAVEGGYTDFGSLENDGDLQYAGELDGFNVYGVGSMPIGVVDVFAKAGAFFWEQSVDVRNVTFSNDGIAPVFGVGVSGDLGNLGVRGEYEMFDVDAADVASMLSLGVAYAFK